jgi:predicted nucleic acid-binding protein
MTIKIIKDYKQNSRVLKPGTELIVTKDKGNELIAKGYAEALEIVSLKEFSEIFKKTKRKK